MVSRDGAFGILMGAALGTLFLVPAHGSAQDSLSVSCRDATYLLALENLTRCAEQGYAHAQALLGLRYQSGEGVPKDLDQAMRWLLRAAQNGDAIGQANVGLMYDSVQGVRKNVVLAYVWYDAAAAQGHESAEGSLPRLSDRMTPDQITEAQRLSRNWQPSQVD